MKMFKVCQSRAVNMCIIIRQQLKQFMTFISYKNHWWYEVILSKIINLNVHLFTPKIQIRSTCLPIFPAQKLKIVVDFQKILQHFTGKNQDSLSSHNFYSSGHIIKVHKILFKAYKIVLKNPNSLLVKVLIPHVHKKRSG